MHRPSATSLVDCRMRGLATRTRVVRFDGYDHANGWVGARVRLHDALAAEVSDATMADLVAALVSIDATVLGPEGRLARLRLADRVAAWAQAASVTALADYAGDEVDERTDQHLRLEVRVARRQSDVACANDVATARALAGACRPVRDLWAQGLISFRHVAAVVDRTALASDELTAAVVDRLAPRLASMPAQRVRSEITRVMARLDPAAQAQHARQARRHDVGVRFRSLPDGLGEVVAVLPVEVARTAMDHVDSAADLFLAHRRGCDPCADAVPDEIGPARAHAFVELLFASEAPGSSDLNADATAYAETADGVRPRRGRRAARRRGEVQVVVDLLTLLGMAENPGLLNGQPVPADLARELAADCGSLRRVVTDPVDGHLLDYGTRIYLPDALRAHVVARDGTCRGPCCGQPAARSQLDHVDPFPRGSSSAANTRMRCKRDHDLKTRGDIVVLAHHADGSEVWRTRHGQTGTTDPRPYLNAPDDDVPPF